MTELRNPTLTMDERSKRLYDEECVVVASEPGETPVFPDYESLSVQERVAFRTQHRMIFSLAAKFDEINARLVSLENTRANTETP